MNIIRKIADFLLATYLFIACSSLSLALTTIILASGRFQLTPLSVFIFFSTLLIYNFHKVSGLFAENYLSIQSFVQRLKKISGLTKVMMAVALIGILISALYVQLKILALFVPLAFITFAYSVPLLKVRGKKKRLREIFLVKITTVAAVWSFTTVTLPLIDLGISPLNLSALILFAERFFFMAAICIPFEIRDMEQEQKCGHTTLPVFAGVKRSKQIGLMALIIFILLVFFQSHAAIFEQSKQIRFELPFYMSAFAASVLIWFSRADRNNYYFRIFVDGTMQLQFLAVLLFNYL